jgi:hypothetical protein
MGSGDYGPRFGCAAPLGSARGCVKRGPDSVGARPSRGLFTAPLANILPGKVVLVNHAAMEGDRIARATARIVAAMRRIETAAQRPGDGDPELARKYQNLRSETGAALAELDRLIGSLEP